MIPPHAKARNNLAAYTVGITNREKTMTSNLKLSPQATTPRPPKLWSVRDAATYCGVSQQTVRRLIKARRLKSYHAGRQIRIAERDLLAYLSRKACS